ncbi:DoxX family protein [Phormidesmis priestleyi ULC007]|uniref:DoxX family protein n=1 Tax=Phormidesmis priestleyi ULC007 TaxID=1920490 RepID=A0A2T1DII5_9CYAN|nr:DoxX family protein [Phormidesmis priestleyi]PSB20275.1 DoxX family protein [Phormidesmis priestleyi ULC007]PZO50144.1 MAG: DoxX family protein [Phormidesmis priestleyi]
MSITPLLTKLLKPSVSSGFWTQTTWAILRTVAGIMMIHNGLDKLGDIQSFSQAYVEVIGLPFPIVFSYLAAFTELLGAPLLAIGLLTRPAAFGLFSTMCVAIYHHILVAGLNLPYLELSAVYAACFLLFAVNGAGLFSTDALLVNWLDVNVLSLQAKQVMGLEKAYQASNSQKESITSAAD